MNKRSILVVDDDPTIRLACTKAFARTHYQVRTAETADEALEMMRAAPAAVLFLDLDLPDRNGLELCQEIRSAWPWSILLAVTGYASIFELVRCREAGFDDYFVKPVGVKELLAAAQHAFRKLDRWKERSEAMQFNPGLAPD